jgi:UDP-N-acetyl-D-mannosaminuronic acid dehydrogenase
MTEVLDVAILGGCGRVGLPLGLAFAARGLRVGLVDLRADHVDLVNAARMPFSEPGAADLLDETVRAGRLHATLDAAALGRARHVVVVINTPVNEYLEPDPDALPAAIADVGAHLNSGQLLVLRTTVPPGATAKVERLMADLGLDVDVAFCPERIAEGRALAELAALPQIVGARSPSARERASKLFGHLTDEMVYLDPEEAELAKLFTNAWRYIKFAAANQLYMVANDLGMDYGRIRDAMQHHYPRAADLPAAGFAGGPCLLKDTMQLAAFSNNLSLGHASATTNEGLPFYVAERMEQAFDLAELTIGVLGMSFKAESDDARASLSYKLRGILRFKARAVLCSDPYVTTDPTLVPLDDLLAHADVLLIGAPHAQYAELETDLPVIDIWNLRHDGVRI